MMAMKSETSGRPASDEARQSRAARTIRIYRRIALAGKSLREGRGVVFETNSRLLQRAILAAAVVTGCSRKLASSISRQPESAFFHARRASSA